MKLSLLCLAISAIFVSSCTRNVASAENTEFPLKGTWKLVSGTKLSKGITTFTDYTKDQEMIKIINETHFAFLKHDLKADTAGKNNFDGGGGRYKLKGNQYTEHLDYYNNKNWEGKTFTFKVTIKNDTLIQTGIEKIESEGIEQTITEKYVRIVEIKK